MVNCVLVKSVKALVVLLAIGNLELKLNLFLHIAICLLEKHLRFDYNYN